MDEAIGLERRDALSTGDGTVSPLHDWVIGTIILSYRVHEAFIPPRAQPRLARTPYALLVLCIRSRPRTRVALLFEGVEVVRVPQSRVVGQRVDGNANA